MAHGDLTGNTKQALAKQHAAEEEAKARALAASLAEAEESKTDEVIDLNDARTPESTGVAEGDQVEVQDVETLEKIVQFKVNSNLEAVTIGHGNNYDFVQGQTYKAPKYVYDHLEEKGLIWH